MNNPDAGPHPEPASSHEAAFRKNFVQFHSETGARYEDFAPFYEYGYRMAHEPRYRGRDFYEVEPELKQAYEKGHSGGDWDRASSAVLFGWEKAGGSAADRFALI